MGDKDNPVHHSTISLRHLEVTTNTFSSSLAVVVVVTSSPQTSPHWVLLVLMPPNLRVQVRSPLPPGLHVLPAVYWRSGQGQGQGQSLAGDQVYVVVW